MLYLIISILNWTLAAFKAIKSSKEIENLGPKVFII